MSTAALLGSVVPGVGNVAGAVVGGLYGLGKGLLGQSKAKSEEQKRIRKENRRLENLIMK